MEHSSHTHPLPHGQHQEPRLLAQPSHALPLQGLSASTPQTSPYQGLAAHSRRLQLRNVHFTASSLSPRRISPLLGLAPGPIESFGRLQDSEDSPLSAEKRSLYGETLPPNPVNILQEIQNSARRKVSLPKPGFGAIFQDQESMDENTKPLDDSEMSWYEERSNECTPSAPRATSPTILREASLNQRVQPPLNFPLTKQTNGRARAQSTMSSHGVEQNRYIEHLESQLASAQARIETLTSPKTIKLRSVKLRSLTVENRNLQRENSEWAKRTEEMVQQERKRYASLEGAMNSRLQAMEEDMEIKDARIAEFEWELETMRAQVKEAEGLEEANANLEKKIDMLSDLLVNSPNRPESRSAATSPIKTSTQFSPSKRDKRPMSVLARASSSPNGARLSLASVSETAFWDSRSRSTSIVETPEDSSLLEDPDEQVQSPISESDHIFPDSSKRFSDSGSYDDRGNSTSFGTRTGPSSSRPTSFMSSSSMGVPSWGVPLQHDSESKISNRQRKMRKFPSGSNTLKPLILPVASTGNVPSLPASAPIYPSIEAVAQRDVSDGSSIDPTTSFLTRLVDSSPYSTPTVPSRQRSTTSVREQTLNALEGKRRNASAEMGSFDGETCVASGSSPEAESVFADSRRRRRSKPESLQKELEQADTEHARLNGLGISASEAFEESRVPLTSRSFDSQDPTYLPQRNATPRARPRSIESNDPITPPTLKARNTTLFNTTPDHPQSLFARVTNLVTQTKQDPFVLARRILTNAWTLGSASMGGMGWWLIGPLHHHQRCRSLECRNKPESHSIPDGSSRRGACGNVHWQHFSAEIRNGRVVDLGPSGECERTSKTPKHPLAHDECKSNTIPPFVPGNSRVEPHLFPCDECVEPSSRRTLRMWFQFSLTVVLAVGLAVKHGPGVLLADLSEDGHTAICPRTASGREQQEQQQRRQERMSLQQDEDDTIRLDTGVGAEDELSSTLVDSRDGADSAYGSIAFAETLGPADFEAG